DADDGHVHRRLRARLLLGADPTREVMDRGQAALPKESPDLLEVVVAPLHEHVEHVLELRAAELARAAALTHPRPEVEDGIGAHVVDPRAAPLAVVDGVARARRVEPSRRSFEITRAPGA